MGWIKVRIMAGDEVLRSVEPFDGTIEQARSRLIGLPYKTGRKKVKATGVKLLARQIPPSELKVGDKLDCGWGYSPVVSVQHSDTHYTAVVACTDKNYDIKAHNSNWPFISAEE